MFIYWIGGGRRTRRRGNQVEIKEERGTGQTPGMTEILGKRGVEWTTRVIRGGQDVTGRVGENGATQPAHQMNECRGRKPRTSSSSLKRMSA